MKINLPQTIHYQGVASEADLATGALEAADFMHSQLGDDAHRAISHAALTIGLGLTLQRQITPAEELNDFHQGCYETAVELFALAGLDLTAIICQAKPLKR